MKNIYTSIAFVLLLVIAAKAQTPTTNPVQKDTSSGSVMTFETMVIDYGTIEYNSDGIRDFKFKNTGNEPLIITSAVGSCQCTVPTYSTEPIKPGGTGVIKVKYNTQRVGNFEKTVTVVSNSKNATIILKIKGTVKADPNAPNSPTPGQK